MRKLRRKSYTAHPLSDKPDYGSGESTKEEAKEEGWGEQRQEEVDVLLVLMVLYEVHSGLYCLV